MSQLLRISKFIHRDSFILQKVKGRSVLHLGCIGETDSELIVKVNRAKELLHSKVKKVASEVYGIDIDAEAIAEYTNILGKKNLFVGDVEKLELVPIDKKFDIILFTDLMEHLSNPGLALEGIKRFMSDESELIVSVPHSFGLPNYIRYILGKFQEGNQHVAAYNSAHLYNLLYRHGFRITEIYSGYERVPNKVVYKILFFIGRLFLSLFPKFGGTLIIVARKLDKGKNEKT